jgi:hypothetical protein
MARVSNFEKFKLMKYFFLLLAFLPALSSWGQAPRPEPIDEAAVLAATITAEELTRHLTILASDEMEGRETGQPGQQLAAEYLASVLADYGLPAIGADGTYFQPISFIAENWAKIELYLNGKELRHLRDYYALPAQNADRGEINIDEVTFLGYGIDDERYSDYTGAGDLTGRTILILSGEPQDRDGRSRLTGQDEWSDWAGDVARKLRVAKDHGVATVIILDAKFRQNLDEARRVALDSRMHMGFSENPDEQYSNSIFISTETARQLLGDAYRDVVRSRRRIERRGRSRQVTFATDMRLTQEKRVRELLGSNVMGYIEGTDPDLKDEVVILSAHYDHIGRRGQEIFNGADDNGSGSSTLLEVCQALVQARENGYGPRRSVLCLWVSGEEKGLLGSQFYVNHPVFPLENTVANVNMDMVGRVDEAHADNPYYIYVIGSDRLSTELHEINETVNEQYTRLELDYTYNAESDPNRYYYRSDHYNFAERGIPAIFYFNGTHADYHQHTDTVEKINFDKMAVIGRLIFHTAWELANRDKRIEVDVPQR